jgi:ribosomal protein S18 acetylase RimI-like enzyme
MVSIRAATVEDVDDVVDLWKREGGPTRHAGQRDETLTLLHRDAEALLVARDDERIVGTLVVGWDGWRCHLYRLAVEPVARRNGVARALVAAARERAAACGAVRLDAMVDTGNTGAIAFWERVGFDVDTHAGRWSSTV